jgi:hypothetical protein
VNIPDGWDLTSATCDDGSDPSAIGLSAGETVKCTFENTGRGDLQITKEVIGYGDLPPDLQFEICIVGPLPATTRDCKIFSQANGWTQTWTDLIPGRYQVEETNPGPAWKVTYDPEYVDVIPGTLATVTVTNEQQYLGYTPGFWKNHGPEAPSGHNAWVYTTYTVTQEICDVFSAACSTPAFQSADGTSVFQGVSLLDGLSLRGGRGPVGGAEILLRAGIAALLNASLSDYLESAGLLNGFAPYPYEVQQIIADVNAALGSEDRQTMLDLAYQLDQTNNGGSSYFDWDWPRP